MALIRIDTLDDPRVAAYRNLKDRELARCGGRFIAEGEHLVRRLLASDFTTESVLMVERRVAEMGALVPPQVPAYAVTQEMLNSIAGMKFHSGVLACGVQKPRPPLEALIDWARPRVTVVVCPEIHNVDNVGSMIRLCAGFGVDALLLGERCHDPFYRQSVRVSMGAIFRLPVYRSDDLMRDVRRMREQWDVELAATVLAPEAEVLTPATQRAPRTALLFGSESQGLEERWVAACDRRLTIPMRLGTDSLNIAVAAGIFLFHFAGRE